MPRNCTTLTAQLVCLVAAVAASPSKAVTAQPADQEVQILAEEMCCKGCARKVSGHLYAARGVKDVGINMNTRMVTVSLPQPNAATLGQLWHAVEQGDGSPTKLITAEATYTLIPPAVHAEPSEFPQVGNSALHIVIDNLHCMGCAKKIAAKLYVLKGVTQVSVNMQKDTLIVEMRPDSTVSPWLAINAVAKANERPVAVIGTHGTLSIEWATRQAPKTHHQAQQTNTGGIQR